MSFTIFNESGVMPGVPGTFANCRVEVREDGSLDVQPLTRHPAYIEEKAPPPTEDNPTIDTVQEQQAPATAP